jgi:hypothetical protein
MDLNILWMYEITILQLAQVFSIMLNVNNLSNARELH